MTLYTANPSNPASCDAFRRAVGFRTREEIYAAELERVVRLIELGASLYGTPPTTVADASKLLAEREALPAEPLSELKPSKADRWVA